MAVKSFRPLTPSSRYVTIASFAEITKSKPEKALTKTRKKTGGRNAYGRVTVRAIGGGHKQKVRQIDFRRNNYGVEATVIAIEYDPIRTGRIALLEYKGGVKTYIIAPNGLQVGTKVMSGPTAPPEIGNALPLKNVPPGMTVHNVEMQPGRGAQMVRSAGAGAVLMAVDEGYAQLKLPSGEIRKVHQDCLATIGQVGNTEHENIILGKAGRTRHRGRRGLTRGMARNPCDHPNGGGQGKSKGGGGRQHLMSPWGLLAKGKRTRKKYKLSSRFIVVRRDGRPMKNK